MIEAIKDSDDWTIKSRVLDIVELSSYFDTIHYGFIY